VTAHKIAAFVPFSLEIEGDWPNFATDYCVKATVLDGLAAGFAVELLVEAIRSVDLAEGDGERALAEVVAAGALLV
jgi:nicotinamidase-related amidase